VLTWNLALNSDGGPHIGGCNTCTGVVTIGSDGSVTRNAEYYALAGVGRFAARGAEVLDTTLDSPSDTALPSVALRNPDGSVAVLVFNDSDEARTVDFAITSSDDHSATARADIPGRTVATVVLPLPADR
jgi:glucosylceramidase